MSLRKKIIMNAGSNWMGQFVMATVGLILIPIMRGKLGADSFGVWFLLSSGLRYPMILESSFSLSINRFVAYYRNDTEQLNRFVSASVVILTVLVLLIVAVAILLSFFITDFFPAITPDIAFDAQITCILVGVTFAFKIMEAAFSGTLMGCQLHTRTNIVIIIANILRAILTVGFLVFWKSIIAVQVAFAISAATSLMLTFIVAKKSIPGLKVNILKLNREIVKELFRYTGHAAARSGGMIFMYSTLTLLIGRFGKSEHLDIYAVASMASGFVRSFLASAQNVFLPVVTSLYADGKNEKIKTVVAKATHISSVITCVPMILLFIYSRQILSLWLKDIAPEMIGVLRMLIIAEAARGFFGIWIPSLVGMGHLRVLTISTLTTSVGAIILELVLLQESVYAPIAAAVSLIAASWVYMGIWLPFYGLYKIQMSSIEYFRSSLLGPVSAAAISVAVLKLLNYIIPPNSVHWMIMFILSGIIVLACFAIISLRSETMEIYHLIRRKINPKRVSSV
jgi:O-antigen/teichoic acid export membrane protein